MIVLFAVKNGQTLLSAFGRIRLNLKKRQKVTNHLPVRFVIIHTKNPGTRSYDTFFPCRNVSGFVSCQGELANRCRIGNCLINIERKCTSFAVNTLHGNFSAHTFRKASGYGKTESGSFYADVSSQIRSFKTVKKIRNRFFLNTAAAVGYAYHQFRRVIFRFFPVNV